VKWDLETSVCGLSEILMRRTEMISGQLDLQTSNVLGFGSNFRLCV
jgi:hypothetical protein